MNDDKENYMTQGYHPEDVDPPKNLKYSPFVYSKISCKKFHFIQTDEVCGSQAYSSLPFCEIFFLSLPARHGKVKQIEIYKFANKAVQHSITIHIWYGGLWHAICVKIMNLSIKLKNLYFAFIL